MCLQMKNGVKLFKTILWRHDGHCIVGCPRFLQGEVPLRLGFQQQPAHAFDVHLFLASVSVWSGRVCVLQISQRAL